MKTLLALVLFLFGLSPHQAAAQSGFPNHLIPALIQVESSDQDQAVGDRGLALGPLQIHRTVVADVNRIYGTAYKHKDMLVRHTAIDVCRKYLAFYGSEKRLGRRATVEDYARIWNGGPSGWKRKATEEYWQKVKRHLRRHPPYSLRQ